MNDQILSFFQALTSDPLIYPPTLFAWTAGFLASRYLNTTQRRKADKEWLIYKVNFGAAFLLYPVFNYDLTLTVLQQSLTAGAAAVLIPAIWFNWKKAHA